jgi:hypothetical protein
LDPSASQQGILEFDRAVKQEADFIIIKEPSAVGDRGHFWRTASSFAVTITAELTLHSDSVARDDMFRVDPFEIGKTMPTRHLFDLFRNQLDHCASHASPTGFQGWNMCLT